MIEIAIENNIVIINFEQKELGFYDSSNLDAINSQMEHSEYKQIQLSLENVRFISSTFMGQLARFAQTAKSKNIEILVKGFVDPFVFQLLSISRLESYMKFLGSINEET